MYIAHQCDLELAGVRACGLQGVFTDSICVGRREAWLIGDNEGRDTLSLRFAKTRMADTSSMSAMAAARGRTEVGFLGLSTSVHDVHADVRGRGVQPRRHTQGLAASIVPG
jgi:hypothetical protein